MPPAARTSGPGNWNKTGQPTEKSLNFGPSARRLISRLRPQRAGAMAVLGLALASVGMAVVGPKILGHATDLIFSGVVGKGLDPGESKEAAVAGLRASGQNKMADMLASMHVTPGRGIDFHALGWVLFGALMLYVGASVLSWLQSCVLNDVVQKTVFQMRTEVEDKLNRLPLRYFDQQPRGEVLSRVTNDIDNVAQSLQQTLSQLVTSLLTVIGVVVMMFIVSPLLALIALVTIPLTMLLTAVIAKRSQKKFVAQWAHTGTLNGRSRRRSPGTRWSRFRPAAARSRTRSGRRTTSCSKPASAPSSSPASSCRR